MNSDVGDDADFENKDVGTIGNVSVVTIYLYQIRPIP